MYIMINAQILKNALLRAAQSINVHRDEVDGINYFPVPDGDTGTNLAMTLSSCAEAIADCETDSAGELADRAADGREGQFGSHIFADIQGLRR